MRDAQKLAIIMVKLNKIGAEYNERVVEKYAASYFDFTVEELRQQSGREIERHIQQELDKRYKAR